MFNYAGKVIIPNGQIVNKQIKKMGPTDTTLGCSFVLIMPFVVSYPLASLNTS